MFPRIFDRYIGRQIWMSTLTGVVVLSGVMVLGNVYKKLDQLLGGTELPAALVAKFIVLVIPFSLIFTIPWAFLTSILLVYGRMSADNELVSLRMTGTSMARICLPVFLLTYIPTYLTACLKFHPPRSFLQRREACLASHEHQEQKGQTRISFLFFLLYLTLIFLFILRFCPVFLLADY